MKYVTTIEDQEFTIEIVDEHTVVLNGETYNIDFVSIGGQPVYSLLIDGQSYEANVYEADQDWQVLLHGYSYPAKVEDERERRLRAALGGAVASTGEYLLKAPMPGLVVSIPVKEGQPVEKGDVLVILESMKMQNELKAPRAGTIGRIRTEVRASVEQKQTLLTLV